MSSTYRFLIGSWLLALLVAACGGGVDPDDEPVAHSGSRLKLRWWQFDDGARTLQDSQLGWDEYFDSALRVDCGPYPWIDGKTYCTPKGNAVVYGDATCTWKVSVGSDELAVDDTARAPASCSPVQVTKVYRVGPATTGSLCDKDDAGTCTCLDGVPVRPLVEELPPSAFVELTLTTATTGRLSVRAREGADGMRRPLAIYDASLGATCNLFPMEGMNTAPCLPKSVDAYFADSACTAAVVTGDQCPMRDEAAAQLSYDGTCAHFAPVGATIPVAPLYSNGSDRCEALPPDLELGDQRWSVGAEVATARMTRAPGAGSHRVRSIYFRADGLAFADLHRLYDSELDTECQLRPSGDGRAACVPSRWQPSSYFADAACSWDHALYVPRSGACGEVYDVPAVVAVGDAEVREVLAPFTGTVYQYAGRPPDFTCVPALTPVTNGYELGPSKPAEFPIATVVAD